MSSKLSDKMNEIREIAEADLVAFIKLIHPQRVLGPIHEDVCRWWTRQDHKSHQLLLLPRDHMKSALVAYRVAWSLTKDPTLRVLYVSSTSNLATKQLKFIKDIFLSPIYRKYWPEMVNEEESKREKWTETEISLDHPLRKKEAIRDPSIFTAGLTTGITGMHCDISVLDDVVVKENAYTDDGREKVKQQYSLLSSIEGTNGQQWVVGTRYHPLDLYNDMAEMVVETYDADGEVTDNGSLYEIMQRVVEDAGDGSGNYLWPRQQRYDGKWFGFDQNILARKRAQYLDRVQFKAQYYNDPNDVSSANITKDQFNYFDPKQVTKQDGKLYFRDRRLNVFAAVDFAFSTRAKADSTAIVVLGVDSQYNYYILDIERFKTTKISDYFAKILALYQRWDFRKIRAEVSIAQKVIVQDLKDNYIRPYGLALSVEEFQPNRHQGSKEERIEAALQPRYANGQMWHFKGGNCALLEEELIMQNPPHDDIKDCLASCVDMAVAPSKGMDRNRSEISNSPNRMSPHPRFGGFL